VKRRAERRGLSLLEVLIGTFVLSVGLLSLAMLIPVGRFAIVETGKADRAGAAGRAALRDIQVRSMLSPYRWRGTVDLTGAVNADFMNNDVVDPATGNFGVLGESFAIDPLLIARDVTGASPQLFVIDHFPYYDPVAASLPVLPTMRRVTTRGLLFGQGVGNTAPFVPSLPLAEQVFRWHDDLLFDIPKEADRRPRRLVRDMNNLAAPYPQTPAEQNAQPLDTANPLVDDYEGSYSWLVTVTPAVAETTMAARAKQRYIISSVVFYKRDLAVDTTAATPGERTVTANILGGGYGGGDVLLTVDTTLRGNATWLQLRENQWLMLCGQRMVPGVGLAGVFRWYRIVAAGEIDTTTDPRHPRRYVTLAGPDWNVTYPAVTFGCCAGNGDTDGDGCFAECEAALFGDGKQGGVIGVYSTTIELN